jgi:hypothetical protein
MVTMAHDDIYHRSEGIDVIVRFHNLKGLSQLERAIFSLVGQHRRPLRILLVMQRFTTEEQSAVLATLAPMLTWSDGVEVVPLNFGRLQPSDARSELVNMGFAAATGRYVALLDYDDVLYPEAYQMLIERLRTSGTAIAFARTPVVTADVHSGLLFSRSQKIPFFGHDLTDLFRENFCPIHSYVIDRSRVPEGSLRFEPSLTITEDYDLLMRLCASVLSDFKLVDVDIGLYFYKTDDSNTYDRDRPLPPEVAESISRAEDFLELRRRMIELAPEVQRSLGIKEPVPGLTVRRWLDLCAAKLRRERFEPPPLKGSSPTRRDDTPTGQPMAP